MSEVEFLPERYRRKPGRRVRRLAVGLVAGLAALTVAIVIACAL